MSSTSNSFKDLRVWQKSIDLVTQIYDMCSGLPANEKYGLASQLQRAGVSIPSNIAEGQRRSNTKEFLQFLAIARSSCAEVETQLIIVQKVYTIDTTELQDSAVEIQKMLSSLIKTLRNQSQDGRTINE